MRLAMFAYSGRFFTRKKKRTAALDALQTRGRKLTVSANTRRFLRRAIERFITNFTASRPLQH